MLNHLTQSEREQAVLQLRERSSSLGIPFQRAQQILFWHSRKSKKTRFSANEFLAWVASLESLVRAFDQAITLQQLRRSGPALQQPFVEDTE